MRSSDGLVAVEPSGSQEHDLVGGLVGEHGVAVRRGRRERGALAADERARCSSVDVADTRSARSSFHTVIELRSTISAPPSTAWTVVSASTLHAGRVGDPLDAVVDDGDGALRAVVDDDDPGGLVDVVVGAGVGDADRGGDLADERG